jgi:hypothetical protein
MSHLNHDSDILPTKVPPEGTTFRQAGWSALTAIAIIFVLFVVFYGIDTGRQPNIASRSTPPSLASSPVNNTTEAPATTTGQGHSEPGTSDSTRPNGSTSGD